MRFDLAIESITKKYAVFDGRAGRAEYWTYILLVTVPTFFLGVVLELTDPTLIPLFQVILGLGLFLPGLAVSIRRLHDLNQSGWWVIPGLIPIIGNIPMVIYFFFKGTDGSNDYGPDPLAQPNTGKRPNTQTTKIAEVPPKRENEARNLFVVKTKPEPKPVEELVNNSKGKGKEAPMNTSSEISRDLESEFFAKALKEIEEDKKDPADWARAFSEADGEAEKAKALYIKQRVTSLTDKFIAEEESRLEVEEEERRVRLEAEEEERRARLEAEEEERRRLAKEVIGTEEKARNILRNLGYKYNLKFSGEWVLNDEVELANNTELFSHLIGLKSELSDDFVIQRLRIAKRLSMLQIGENKFEVRSNSGNLTFNSPSELREYAIQVLFMEDD